MSDATAWSPAAFMVAQVNAAGLMKVEKFTATLGQTVFTLTTYAYAINTGSVLVFRNGLLLNKTEDYTETSTAVITLVAGSFANDEIVILGMVGITGTANADAILRADLAADSGSNIVGFLQAGSGMVGTKLQTKLRYSNVSLFDGMTAAQQASYIAGTGIDDLTAVYIAAYTAASTNHKKLELPAGLGRITANLTWDQSVDVIGDSFEFTVIQKDVTAGDFIGITIGGAAQQSRFQDFRLTTHGTVATSDGIKIVASARMNMKRVQSDHHGGHGINIHDTGVNGMGVFSRYEDIVTNLNGADGFHMDYQYASIISNLNSSQNGGYGFNETQGNSTDATALICENNVLGGSRADTCVANIYRFYGESNTGADMILTGGSTRNYIITYHADAVSDDSDEGTNNVVLDIGLFPMFSCPTIGRIPRTTNVAGRSLLVKGGLAGPGVTGHSGGPTNIQGGDANGDTLAAGAPVNITGGDGVHGGDRGAVTITAGGIDIETTDATFEATTYLRLNPVNKKAVVVGGVGAPPNASVSLSLQSVNQFMKLNVTNTAGVNALITTDGQGMFGFNQTGGVLCPVFWDGAAWQKVSFTAM